MADARDPQKGEIKQQTTAIKQSARAVEQSASELVAGADRRTVLAGDRTLLASERTYAAWVRTALAALASGVGGRALMHDVLPDWVGKVTGTVLVVFALFCLVAAIWREIHGTPAPPQPDMRRIPIGLLLPMTVLLMLVAIAALVGIWAV